MTNLITISEAGDRLHLSRSTINRMLDAGAMRRIRFGRAVRIPSEDVEAFVQRLQSAG